ncbi:MAG: ubiquitin-like domain-containing protein [Anaerolineae bacterium]
MGLSRRIADVDRRLLGLGLAALGMLTCAVVCLGGLLVTVLNTSPAIPLTLIVEGTGYQVRSHAQTVGATLKEFGISLNEGDSVSPPLDAALKSEMVIRLDRARIVTVIVDGSPQVVYTTYSNPMDILQQADIEVNPNDQITIDGTQTQINDLLVWPVPVNAIDIQRAMLVTIVDGDQTTTVETTASTIGQALFEAGITLYLADKVTPELNEQVTANLHVDIHRSQPISIVADGVTLETRTQGSTVQDALVGAGVTLVGLDYAIPTETSLLQAGMTIRIIRVNEIIEVEQSVVPFETVFQPDNTLELDQERVIQEGQNGVTGTNVRVRYENGIEVSRTAEENNVAKDPINRVIAYGTNIVLRTIDTPDGPKEYWRILRMYTTSYHPAALGGDDVTATGRKLTKGVVGIDPKIIPYGSQVYVAGYGVGVAADTGGPRKFKLWIDLGYDDSNWISWSKYTDVYLLTPVPPNVRYILPE